MNEMKKLFMLHAYIQNLEKDEIAELQDGDWVIDLGENKILYIECGDEGFLGLWNEGEKGRFEIKSVSHLKSLI